MGDKTPSSPLLVLVHPGSACGSADFSLGRYIADGERDFLAYTLDRWNDGIIVIDGSLSDELSSCGYRRLGTAIEDCLKRAGANGFIAHREWGCDDVAPHQSDAARAVISRFSLSPETTRIVATGCWYDDTDENTGCVNDVADVFSSLGFNVAVDDSAIRHTASDDEEE